jgi:hypothetical protein
MQATLRRPLRGEEQISITVVWLTPHAMPRPPLRGEEQKTSRSQQSRVRLKPELHFPQWSEEELKKSYIQLPEFMWLRPHAMPRPPLRGEEQKTSLSQQSRVRLKPELRISRRSRRRGLACGVSRRKMASQFDLSPRSGRR